ncbi:HAD family hydrolase [Saccharibacillus sacchari]|uniref:HAD family hydrolase n=1 Tax=Saccharibacillus sacchari TaxID=456493 RepID=A0ACC6PJ04_9BACL
MTQIHSQKTPIPFDAAQIKVIAFDLDGTLIDTSQAMLDVNHEVFSEAIHNGDAKKQPTKDEIYSTFGMIGDEAWNTLASEIPDDRADQYKERHNELLRKKMDAQSFALPGVAELLKSLADRYDLATASNCGEGYLERVLAQDGLKKVITYPLCAGSVNAEQKSDVLRELLRQSGLDTSQVLMVGDRKSDVDAARKAGIPVVGVRSEFGEENELQTADAVIDTIGDLKKLLKL